MKKNVIVFMVLLSAFLISFSVLTLDLLNVEKPQEVYNISVIVRGKNSESWENIKQGADQAAGEMNVDLSFITLSKENSLSEQMSLLRRELEAGVDAIVISATDSAGLATAVKMAAESVPVICIESTVDSPAVTAFISADNSKMGGQLASEIIASGNSRKRLAVVYGDIGCRSIVERRAGLMSVLGRFGGEIAQWELPNDSEEAAAELAVKLRENTADVIVALDTSSLELAAQAIVELQATKPKLFGIGATGKIASLIEQDVVTATVVQNDFGIGYLGVKSAVDAIKKRPVEQVITVEHQLITFGNMYERENQRLLFPFIR